MTLAARILTLLLATATPVVAVQANTLKWAASRDIGSLDPDSFGDTFTLAFLNHVYEGLVRYDSSLKIEPALATSWELVSPTVWRFHLRPGVKFQDGAPLTADDVVASLQRATDDLSPLKGNLAAYKSSRVVDPMTVDIELTSKYPLLLNDLTNIFIFSKPWLVTNHTEVATDVGRKVEGYATTHANGTGPFKVESRAADSSTILVVNKGWWDTPKHNLDRIEFLPINNDATRLAALVSGEIDLTNAVPLQAAARLETSAGVKVLMATELRTIFFALNYAEHLPSHPDLPNPLRDKRVRQAMYQAIDIDGIRRSVMRGQSRDTGALVAPSIPGFLPGMDKRLPYDLDAAKALMKDAGFPDGFGLTLVCTGEGYVNEEQICQATASMWAKIGIKVDLQTGTRASITQRRVAGQFDVTPLGWANEPAIDAESLLLQVVHSKTSAAGVFNWGGWGRTEIDSLTDQAANELDTKTRLAEEGKALSLAEGEILFLPLHEQPMAWAKRDTVDTVVQLPDNKVRLWLTRMGGK
ncbi:ABC transporter substrate-binding protein [Acidisphaera sp. L21]|uniref:ABC transporter substrate-binding protein n=1 Tax=Acidisphaera sp. L21 TaxID=1641851 RepID=UPI001C20432B|nr:ABC transporter substrate-binding protein [Acidisphaera sp. L21]